MHAKGHQGLVFYLLLVEKSCLLHSNSSYFSVGTEATERWQCRQVNTSSLIFASASFTVEQELLWHNEPILIEPRFFGQSLRDDLLAGEGCIFQATLPMGLRAARLKKL